MLWVPEEMLLVGVLLEALSSALLDLSFSILGLAFWGAVLLLANFSLRNSLK